MLSSASFVAESTGIAAAASSVKNVSVVLVHDFSSQAGLDLLVSALSHFKPNSGSAQGRQGAFSTARDARIAVVHAPSPTSSSYVLCCPL